MELLHWPGDYGLASVDVDCLQVMAYCKMVKSNVQFKKYTNTFKTPNGKLPLLRGEDTTIDGKENIIARIKQEKNLDQNLDCKTQADILAFTTLIEKKLKPAVLYLNLVDSENFTKISRRWYANVLPFPLNYFVPGKLHRQASNYVEALYNLDEKAIGVQVINTAKDCIDVLANRLGELAFFCGEQPTSLDAIVYAYLAVICKMRLCNNVLRSHVQRYSNLINLMDRIHSACFRSEEDTPPAPISNEQFSLTDKLYFAGLAVAATIAYVAFSGFITFATVDQDDDDLADDDDDDYIDDD